MKYEYLCGYESDFFAMPENVIAVVRLDHCVQGLTEFNQITECGKPVLAMRRIIPEPKRWTVEDQKAGRMPEVGCRVNFCHKLNTNWRTGEIKYIDDQVVVIKTDDIARPFVYEVERVEYKPIETPEEKAQREEDEFVKLMIDLASESQLMSCGFKDGVISAYRKLKGGE